jgi:RND superfamily putative drug exporter
MLMRTIARWTMAHRRLVLLAWLVGALGLFAVSQSVGSKSVNTFSLPGTGSQQATNLLQNRFSAQAGDTDQIVFKARSGKLTNPADRTSITSTLDRVARLPHVSSVVSPYASPGQISRDGTIAFAMVRFDQSATALSKTAVNRVITTAQSARSATLQVELGGQAIENAQRTSPGSATMIGIVAAIVILLIAFGSALTMSLPLITAGLGLLAGLGLIALASHLINMANFASELALMIGLGVGVDYALFIVTRFRENYRTNGGDVRQAVETALNTSGRAVLFAGATVVIALLGMFAVGIDLLNGLAIAAAVGVLSVLAASLTLLPALLSMAGRRIGRKKNIKENNQKEDNKTQKI